MMTVSIMVKGLTPRLLALLAVFTAAAAMLLSRLAYEQVFQGSRHRELISEQSVRRIRIAPTRGRIFDRDLVAMTDNQPSYDVLFHIHEMRQPRRRGGPTTLEFVMARIEDVCRLTGRDNEVTASELEYHVRVYPALPFKAMSNLNEAELARLLERMPGIPGLEIATTMTRTYPLGAVGCHVIGFVGRRQADDSDLETYSYFRPELSGRNWLEMLFNDQLRGTGGHRLIQVNSVGYFHDELTLPKPARPGDDIVLTIDSRAQALAQRLLADRRGAMAVVECNSGAVIALASAPAYNLNEVDVPAFARLAEDRERLPLMNRALAGGYLPGSIVKPLVALAALQQGLITPEEPLLCEGYHAIGDTRIGCTGRHGQVNVATALEVSCNAYFIALGLRLGLDRLQPTLAAAGIGQPLDWPLQTDETGFRQMPNRTIGLLPSREHLREKRGRAWNAFDTGLVSIGQGAISLCPLQAALYTAAVANGGTVYQPRIVKSLQDSRGITLQTMRPVVRSRLQVSSEALAVVQQGMRAVVIGRRATAPAARSELVAIAGKTGSAQVGSGEHRHLNTWFVCFAPYDQPKYAMAVLIEDGVSGGVTAAPLARAFLEQFLADE